MRPDRVPKWQAAWTIERDAALSAALQEVPPGSEGRWTRISKKVGLPAKACQNRSRVLMSSKGESKSERTTTGLFQSTNERPGLAPGMVGRSGFQDNTHTMMNSWPRSRQQTTSAQPEVRLSVEASTTAGGFRHVANGVFFQGADGGGVQRPTLGKAGVGSSHTSFTPSAGGVSLGRQVPGQLGDDGGVRGVVKEGRPSVMLSSTPAVSAATSYATSSAANPFAATSSYATSSAASPFATKPFAATSSAATSSYATSSAANPFATKRFAANPFAATSSSAASSAAATASAAKRASASAAKSSTTATCSTAFPDAGAAPSSDKGMDVSGGQSESTTRSTTRATTTATPMNAKAGKKESGTKIRGRALALASPYLVSSEGYDRWKKMMKEERGVLMALRADGWLVDCTTFQPVDAAARLQRPMGVDKHDKNGGDAHSEAYPPWAYSLCIVLSIQSEDGEFFSNATWKSALTDWVRSGGVLMFSAGEGRGLTRLLTDCFQRTWEFEGYFFRRLEHQFVEGSLPWLGRDCDFIAKAPRSYSVKAFMLSKVPPQQRVYSPKPSEPDRDSRRGGKGQQRKSEPGGSYRSGKESLMNDAGRKADEVDLAMCPAATCQFGRGIVAYFGDVEVGSKTVGLIVSLARSTCSRSSDVATSATPSSNGQSRNALVVCCNVCGMGDGTVSKLHVCGGCRRVRYCGKECQKTDWQMGHKNLCNKAVAEEYHKEQQQRQQQEQEQQQQRKGRGKKGVSSGKVKYADDWIDESQDESAANCCGFTESDLEELLGQGVKPWDPMAMAVLGALSMGCRPPWEEEEEDYSDDDDEYGPSFVGVSFFGFSGSMDSDEDEDSESGEEGEERDEEEEGEERDEEEGKKREEGEEGKKREDGEEGVSVCGKESDKRNTKKECDDKGDKQKNGKNEKGWEERRKEKKGREDEETGGRRDGQKGTRKEDAEKSKKGDGFYEGLPLFNSYYTYGRAHGFTNDEIDDLVCQGVSPWSPEARRVVDMLRYDPYDDDYDYHDDDNGW
ncbi:hypothetical protein CBR_g55081 [Chara braunii]|uniref:phytol kinase n=1 Tax=Chara braunii TaxID=69332 RepID=A0A388MCW3_CHABU|nr:hypothetical protein CBR_g55081 [Chara braunii]|eukprot:GBG92312.1 hypothetical protein CBR_g55081 [Chara braunii]